MLRVVLTLEMLGSKKKDYSKAEKEGKQQTT